MKNWKLKPEATTPPPALPEYPPLLVKLLAMRGLVEPDDIYDFLNPDYSKLIDPFRFKHMQLAVDRINKAIRDGEKITIYADYDADAITAASVVYLALKKLGNQADYYIPDRFSEGYGMNAEAVRIIAENKTKLIITVDCGINAVNEALVCRELGIDLIITDHHELTGELPDAFAVINPKNPLDEYPFQHLTGVGVAYKLVQALFVAPTLRSGHPSTIVEGWEKWLLDLVAIGTVADCQSLSGENRIMVSYGLKVLAKTKWPGLKALLNVSGFDNGTRAFDTFTLGFVLAPRINAAGRIKHGDTAFKLLVAEDPHEAEKLALELNQLNQHRQLLTETVLSEARAQLQTAGDQKVLVAVGKDWPKGVVGLVAGKLMEEYSRPVLAISSEEGMATGSARSLPEFDIVAALNAAKDLLHKYGGHTQAAGFTLKSENLPMFHERLLQYAEGLNIVFSGAALEADAELSPEDISWEAYGLLEKMAPFGYGNPKPKFVGRNLEVLECRTVGANNKHAKFKLRFGEHVLGGIGFGLGFLASKFLPGSKIDCMFELISNEWNGNKELQLKLVDAKTHE